MKSSDTVAMPPRSTPDRPPRSAGRFRFLEGLVNLIVLLVVIGVMLWNWDGFWQTDIPELKAVQARYFPVKYAEEQDKLTNSQQNSARWVKAQEKIEALEAENEKLKAELAARGK